MAEIDYMNKTIEGLLTEVNSVANGRNDSTGFASIIGVFIQNKLMRELINSQAEQHRSELRNTRWLVWATWVLAIATIIMAWRLQP